MKETALRLLLAAVLAVTAACSDRESGSTAARPEPPAAGRPSVPGDAPSIEPNLEAITKAADVRCAEVRGRLDSYRKVERDLTGLSGLSAEGGELTAWLAGDRPELIAAKAYGETGRAEYQLCYGEDGDLLVFRSEESRYDQPMGQVVETRVERFFFHDGKLTRWTVGEQPPVAQTLTAAAGARASDLLELSRIFVEAARSPGAPPS
ncbi:MAG TPA: hypothetical protein VEL74_01965 [Thermoanaerobaculia bacterium]|nr:hypothetical protein [Thermoanaerobaculia bacterium]